MGLVRSKKLFLDVDINFTTRIPSSSGKEQTDESREAEYVVQLSTKSLEFIIIPLRCSVVRGQSL